MKTRSGLSDRLMLYKNIHLHKVGKVTAKETKKRDGLSCVVPPMKLPMKLYELVVEAVELRKRCLKAKPENAKLRERLNHVEYGITLLANIYKKTKHLPRDWKFDPDIADTLVDNGCLVGLEDVDYPKPRKMPKTSGVPLNESEKEIWHWFTEFENETPLESVCFKYRFEKENEPVRIDSSLFRGLSKSIVLEDPMVDVIANFAVDTFNKAYEMLVNEKEPKRIQCFEHLKFSYIKMRGVYSWLYYFYLTIKGVEKGKVGFYETIVRCDVPNGCRRLCRFVLITGPEPEPEHRIELTYGAWLSPAHLSLAAPTPTPTPTVPTPTPTVPVPTPTPTPTPKHKGMRIVGVMTESEDEEKDISSSSEYEDEEFCGNLRSNTGMIYRRKGATCRGYDFYYPCGILECPLG